MPYGDPALDDPLASLQNQGFAPPPEGAGPSPNDQVANWIFRTQQSQQPSPSFQQQPPQQPYQPRTQQLGGVRGILQSVMYGAAHSAGIETPEERQQRAQELQQKREWQQSQLEQNRAQIANTYDEIRQRNRPIAPAAVSPEVQAFQYKVNVEGKHPDQAWSEVKREGMAPQKPEKPDSPIQQFIDEARAKDPKAPLTKILRDYRDATTRPPASTAAETDINTLAQGLVDPRNLTALKDVTSLRGSQRLQAYAAAKRLDPNFDPGLTNQRIKFLQSYEDPKGRAATNRQSINNIMQHAGDLSEINEQGRRLDVRILNTPINKIRQQFGDQSYTQYQDTANVLKDELSLYFAGGYAPSKDQQGTWDRILSDEATPAQIEQFTKDVIHLGLRRADTFNQQFRTNMGYDDPNMITPEAKAAAEKLGLGNQASRFGSGGQLGQQPRQQPAEAPADFDFVPGKGLVRR